jgi:hypothetical protein
LRRQRAAGLRFEPLDERRVAERAAGAEARLDCVGVGGVPTGELAAPATEATETRIEDADPKTSRTPAR